MQLRESSLKKKENRKKKKKREKIVSRLFPCLPVSDVCISRLTEINAQLTSCRLLSASRSASFILSSSCKLLGIRYTQWILAGLSEEKRKGEVKRRVINIDNSTQMYSAMTVSRSTPGPLHMRSFPICSIPSTVL